MKYKIIDAHSHLWLKQDTVVDNKPIRTLNNGRSLFMGEVRQMLPPFMIDGRNSAEVFLSNMDYAQVGAAVVTQEYIMTICWKSNKNILTDFSSAGCANSANRDL